MRRIKRKIRPELDMVPMVDMVLILLVFFMDVSRPDQAYMDQHIHWGGSHEPLDLNPPIIKQENLGGCTDMTLIEFKIDKTGDVFAQFSDPLTEHEVLEEYWGISLDKEHKYCQNVEIGSFTDSKNLSLLVFKLTKIARVKNQRIKFWIKADENLPTKLILNFMDILQSLNVNRFTLSVRERFYSI